MTGVVAVLSRYPREVIDQVTHPATGLPATNKWLPTVSEVREACEAAMAPIERNRERERVNAEMDERRKAFDEARAKAPTMADLREKYGEGWGVSSGVANEFAARRKRNLELVAEANRKVFEQDCREAGIEPKALGVSPELARQIETRRRFDDASRSIQEAAE